MNFLYITKIWGYISASKVFWNIVRNWYWLKSCRDELEKILLEIQRTKSLPDQQQIKIILKMVRESLEKGLIDLPHVDEASLAFELSKIEANLISQVQKTPKIEAKNE